MEMKRFLAVIICFCMAVNMTAYAKETGSAVEKTQQEEEQTSGVLAQGFDMNDWNKANTISPGIILGTGPDAMGKGVVDRIKVWVKEKGIYTLQDDKKGDGTGAEQELKLYDSTGQEISILEESSNETTYFYKYSLNPGTYYLRLESLVDNNFVQLGLYGVWNQAPKLSFDSKNQTGTLKARQEDGSLFGVRNFVQYQVEIPKSNLYANYFIEDLERTGGDDKRFLLCDSDGRKVYESPKTDDYTYQYGLSGGTYYLAILSDSDEELPYNVTLRDEFFSKWDSMPELKKDGNQSGTFEKSGDMAGYKIVIKKAGKYTIADAVKGDGTGMKESFYLFDDKRNKVEVESYAIGNTDYYIECNLEPGTYYLALRSGYQKKHSYDLHLTLDPWYDWDNVQELKFGENKSGTLQKSGDIAKYKITIDKAGTYTIADDVKKGNTEEFYLYNSKGNKVEGKRYALQDKGVFVEYNNLDAGTYYLVLKSTNFDGAVSYSLRIINDVLSCLNHKLVKSVIKNPCVSEGLIKYSCAACGFERTETVPKAGHKYKVTTVNPTCTKNGYKQYSCTVCGYKRTDTLTQTGHKYKTTTVNPTCTKNGYKKDTCTTCGYSKTNTLAKKGHRYGSWKKRTSATVFKQATRKRTCSSCKSTQTQSYGSKVKAKIKLNARGTVPLKVRQTLAVKVSKSAGDSVKSWKTSNKKVATVSKSGKVKGKKSGKSRITVTLKSGKKASFVVKVQKSTVRTKSIKSSTKKITLRKGKTYKLSSKISVSPITSREKVRYSSRNKRVVTVSSKGTLRAKRKGSTYITVKSGKKSTKVKVTVK